MGILPLQCWGRDMFGGDRHVPRLGQFDCVQRSLIFIYVGLEQGPNSFIYRPSSPRASRDQSDLSIEKGDFSELSLTASG